MLPDRFILAERRSSLRSDDLTAGVRIANKDFC
jgi:hypothetical protein